MRERNLAAIIVGWIIVILIIAAVIFRIFVGFSGRNIDNLTQPRFMTNQPPQETIDQIGQKAIDKQQNNPSPTAPSDTMTPNTTTPNTTTPNAKNPDTTVSPSTTTQPDSAALPENSNNITKTEQPPEQTTTNSNQNTNNTSSNNPIKKQENTTNNNQSKKTLSNSNKHQVNDNQFQPKPVDNVPPIHPNSPNYPQNFQNGAYHFQQSNNINHEHQSAQLIKISSNTAERFQIKQNKTNDQKNNKSSNHKAIVPSNIKHEHIPRDMAQLNIISMYRAYCPMPCIKKPIIPRISIFLRTTQGKFIFLCSLKKNSFCNYYLTPGKYTLFTLLPSINKKFAVYEKNPQLIEKNINLEKSHIYYYGIKQDYKTYGQRSDIKIEKLPAQIGFTYLHQSSLHQPFETKKIDIFNHDSHPRFFHIIQTPANSHQINNFHFILCRLQTHKNTIIYCKYNTQLQNNFGFPELTTSDTQCPPFEYLNKHHLLNFHINYCHFSNK